MILRCLTGARRGRDLVGREKLDHLLASRRFVASASAGGHSAVQGRPFTLKETDATNSFVNWYRLYVPEPLNKATIVSVRPVLVPFFGFFADRGRQRVVVYGGYEYSDQQVESLKVDPQKWTRFDPSQLDMPGLIVDTWSVTAASAAHKASLEYPHIFDGPVPPHTQALLPGYQVEFSRRGQTFKVLVGAETGKASGLRHFSFWSGLWEGFTFGLSGRNNQALPFLLMLFPRLVPPIGLGFIIWGFFRTLLSPLLSSAAEKLMNKMPIAYRNTAAGGRVERIIAHQWGHYDPKDTQTSANYAEREKQMFKEFFRNLEEQFRQAAANQQGQQQQQREFYEQYYRRQQSQQQQQQQSYSRDSNYNNRGSSSSSSTASSKDPYTVLGVSRNATNEELRQAFRKKLLQYHPDHYQGKEGPEFAKQKTQEVVDAYRSLKKPS